MDYKKFSGNLKIGEVKNVYLFYGEQPYLLRFYLNQLIETILNEQFKSFNVTKFSDGFDYEKILDIVETYPVFDEKRIVICENTGKFKPDKKKKGEEAQDKATDKKKNTLTEKGVAELIEQVPETTILVFVESNVNRTRKEFKLIDKLDGCVEFASLQPGDLKKWISKQVKVTGRTISIEAIDELIKYCSTDMDELSNEINKLISFVGEGEAIERGHIEMITTKTIKTVVFDLTDAIGDKNINKAISVLENIISLNEPVQKIFIMLANHLRHLEKIRNMLDDGKSKSDILSTLGIKSGYYGDKLISQSRRFSAKQLKKAVTDCSRYDYDIKTGNLKDRMAVELVLASLLL